MAAAIPGALGDDKPSSLISRDGHPPWLCCILVMFGGPALLPPRAIFYGGPRPPYPPC